MKLTTISKWIWFWLALVFVASVILLIFIFNYKIEKTEKINLYIDEKNRMHLLGNNKLFYSLKQGQKIILKINEKAYDINVLTIKILKNSAQIDFTSYDDNLRSLLRKDINIDGVIHLGETTLFNLLFKQ
ncbi:hypothetical protein MBOVJF4428_00539 [Mycoplasmopsis agalactiae]|uniref:Uncharacterized protein n=1 Tax=Mycoplasmopsis agalactiae (strain NCTC 10123 / CIP 59.7 / PG2) TaxID=347257 RepID=A5IXQ3_MYCAP|nr:hypothetical protein [Mycoplasmopsis agalactiae]MCE6056912.1 hypothetical protein [Mycoplasmopsis agalactiae]MCE6078699.1 hypothetical protein [Mycoplasmopsis agalactiae]MCE6095085.1 hypothetical protein [Mycoplasmopsis agalactiae]MCE6114337.1 hypothetical protein [Mycoplasmopsis agalactiae]MCE6114990.1 hypothetical protein [Mycoplasmopsis agalactiae]